MKSLIVLMLSFLPAVYLMGQVVKDPNAEVRTASGFHAINVSSAFDVYLSQGNEEAVAVSAANEKDKESIRVEVKNGVLHISYDSRGMKWASGNKKLKAYISFKKINSLNISGACDVVINGVLKADELSIIQSGASDLKGALDVAKLKVDLNGASDSRLTGKARSLSVEASGASSFKGYELQTDICDARASGASDIKITVNNELSAQASGASDIHYRGNGQLKEVRSSGSSSVKKG